jgi:peptidoglycan-associated lipoprotein
MAILLGTVGCSTTNDSKPSSAATTTQASNGQSKSGAQKSQALGSENLRGGQDRSSLDALRRGETPTTPRDSGLKEVYFDFDRYNLDSEDRLILKSNANWLKLNPAARVEIEGHCDERGTNEYNLALGAKRAQAAKDYLTSLGVAQGRISTTSYGEEIPVCRGHSEECWQKNRRDRFVTLSSKPGA